MKPLFIPTATGNLFAIYYPPASLKTSRTIIHIPAFAEEMNKARRMVSLQAQAFARLGHGVLILDLFGTGDSAGDFADATWQIWLQNIDDAVAWLNQQGVTRIDLWGLRTGALLAIHYIANGNHIIGHLLCWQPVLSGDAFVTQFLRLRIAAAMMNNNPIKETTNQLKQQLAHGQSLEVAGYGLHPALITPLMAINAQQFALTTLGKVAVMEVVSSEATLIAAATSQFLTALQQQHVDVTYTSVTGDLFWTTQETGLAMALIPQSNQWLTGTV